MFEEMRVKLKPGLFFDLAHRTFYRVFSGV
jgi:hypothetical protein